MVFKVKQRAETNYFKKMQKDRLPLNHPDKALSVENDIFEYGFNWPYDYFSMVELIKLDAEVGFSQSNLIERDMNAIKAITGVGDNTNTASAATAIRSLITLDNSPPEENTKD